MKKSFVLLLILLLATINLYAGNTIRKEFNLSAFNKIEISSAFNVQIKQGNAQSVVFEIDEDLLNNLKVEVYDGKLKVWVKQGFGNKNLKPMNLNITVSDLRELEVNGACKIDLAPFKTAGEFEIDLSGASKLNVEKITARKVDIEISGASNLNITMDASEMEIDASGASKAVLNGNADRQSYEASGASNISASDLNGSNANAEASGASRISVGAKNINSKRSSGAASIKTK